VDPRPLGLRVVPVDRHPRLVVRLKYPGNKHERLHRLLSDRREILECLRTTGDDCYTLKVAAASMPHLEELVNELTEFGSTTTNLVYSQTQPYRGPHKPVTEHR